MLVQTQVGPIASTNSLTPGTPAPARADQLGALVVSEHSPQYYEAVYRKLCFNTANQAATVTTVGLATTYTGLCIANPVGATINAVIQFVGFAFPVAPAADVVVGIMVGYNAGTNITNTTPGVVKSNFWGVGTTGQVVSSLSATLPTAPVLAKVLGKVDTGAITTTTQGSSSLVDLKGNIVLPPGAYAAIYTSSASAASGFFGSFDWVELPI